MSAQDQGESGSEAAAPHDANRVQTVEAPIQGRYPLVLMVKGHRVHCMSKFAEDVAQRVNSQTFQPGDVQGFVRDDKTGTLILARCIFGDSTDWGVILKHWKQKDQHAAAFLNEYGAAALERFVKEHDCEIVLVPVLGHNEKHSSGVLLEWLDTIVKGKPNVQVDAKILSHDTPIGKPPHKKPDERHDFHEALPPEVNRQQLAGHRDKLVVVVATNYFTHAKLNSTLKVLAAAADGLNIKFESMAVVGCGSAISRIDPIAVTQEVHEKLVAASALVLRDCELTSTDAARAGFLYAGAVTGIDGRYVGSHVPDKGISEDHVPALLRALDDRKQDDIASECGHLLHKRGGGHQYDLLRRTKGPSFMRWFDEVRDGDREFHFSECMEAQAILPRCENESAEALKRRTLAFEDAALKLADEQARSGGPPKLNVAINAFNIAGLKVPDPEKGDEMVAVGHTQKSYRRRVATILGRTCVQTAAVALAEAGEDAAVVAAAQSYYEAAVALRDADKALKSDALILYDAAEGFFLATRAHADAVEAAAKAVAADVVDASKAVITAARAVADAEGDAEIAALVLHDDAVCLWRAMCRVRDLKSAAEVAAARDLVVLSRAVVDAEPENRAAARVERDKLMPAAKRTRSLTGWGRAITMHQSHREQRLAAERDQKDEDALDRVARSWRAVRADDAADTAAVDAVLKAWRASKDVVAAKPEEKKELRRKRDQRIKEAIAARCQCPSTCVLVGAQFSLRRHIMVPSYRRLRRGSSASSR